MADQDGCTTPHHDSIMADGGPPQPPTQSSVNGSSQTPPVRVYNITRAQMTDEQYLANEAQMQRN